MPSKPESNQQQHLGVGVALDVAICAGLGVAFGNSALGIGPGIAIGAALGIALFRGKQSGCNSKQPAAQDGPER